LFSGARCVHRVRASLHSRDGAVFHISFVAAACVRVW
jgi:hypothetical protein